MSAPTITDYPMFRSPSSFIEGKITGSGHWDEIYTNKGHAILDTLTGKIYDFKCCCSSRFVALHVALTTPLVAIATIAYNILRMLPILLYYAVQSLRESGKRAEHLTTLKEQLLLSIKNVIRTPYYALGMFFSTLYWLVDPPNGRKCVAGWETEWNHGIPLAEGFWSVRFARKNFSFEGKIGGETKKPLGHHAFYLAGCCQPLAQATLENVTIDVVKRTERAGGDIEEITLSTKPAKIVTKVETIYNKTEIGLREKKDYYEKPSYFKICCLA